MKLSSKHTASSTQRGFGLSELLIAIAVIGVIAAIANTMIGRVNSASRDAAAQRNAQNIASLSSSANAVGAYHVIPESMGGGVAMSVDVLTKGVNSGTFGMQFQINLNEKEILAAADYLTIENLGSDYALVYNAK